MAEDPNRFQSMASQVAAIPLDGPRGSDADVDTGGARGLRPAISQNDDLKVEVMDPHDLWDARDAGLRGAIHTAAPRMVEAAAPTVARLVGQQVSTRLQAHDLRQTPPVKAPEATPALAPPGTPARATIQLGAYSSDAAARAAWERFKGGSDGALRGLSPVFERVEVDGRPLTRLKVSAPAEAAVALCRAARVADPWCARRA